MAGHDIFNDVTPKQTLKPNREPSISQYKAAIAASPQATSYNTQRMSLNDLQGICRVHNIAVPTT